MGGRRGRRGGRESRRERRRDGRKGGEGQGRRGELGGERGTGSDKGNVAKRNMGANGRAGGDRWELLHAMQTHEHSHIHTVRPTVPDSNSVSQRESKRREATGHRASHQIKKNK